LYPNDFSLGGEAEARKIRNGKWLQVCNPIWILGNRGKIGRELCLFELLFKIYVPRNYVLHFGQ
jgi:hypothetical protein